MNILAHWAAEPKPEQKTITDTISYFFSFFFF